MVGPLDDSAVFTNEELVNVTWGVATVGRIGDHNASSVSRTSRQFMHPRVFHLGGPVPHEMEGEQKPVLVIDEGGVNLLQLLRGLDIQFTAEIGELHGLALLVCALKADAIRLRLPHPRA